MPVHSISPVFDSHSHILVLGSFPSVASRESGFFYGHPQNRFWRVLSAVFGCTVPSSVADKKELLLSHGVALWDVLHSCDISGSSDISIRNAVPNDLQPLIEASEITHVFTNGSAAHSLYLRFQLPLTKLPAVKLPSTSPANAAFSLERLISEWSVIK